MKTIQHQDFTCKYSLRSSTKTTVKISPVPMASQLSLLILMLFLFNLASIHVTGDQIMLEDGYMVSTVFDGYKLNINPYAVQLRSSDLVVLDSSHSVFYTLPFPISQDSVMVNRLSGEGKNGYTDGEPGLARFNKPKSFAVDLRGNVYVADQLNHVVRKISNSGVTSTIVGNYSRTGRQDGPGETATFSGDFEVLFVPQICALLISDHGNQLLRQIDLKPEDCAFGPQSVPGAVKFWVLGLALSCLLGIVIGIATRPYVIPHTGRFQTPSSQQDMEALPNQSGESSTDELLRHQKRIS